MKDDDLQNIEESQDDVDMEPSDELGDVGALQAKLKKVRDELAAVKKERQEFLDGWQRSKADAINQRREQEAVKGRAARVAAESFLEALIPALDSFDMAMGGDAWQNIDPTWRKGIESIHQQIIAALESQRIDFFGSTGDLYDPTLHDVLGETDEDGASGTVSKVVRRGWKLEDKIIRPAQIILHRNAQ